MSGHFEALPDGGAAVPLDEVEVSILRSLAVQMLELIGPGDEPARGEDPLAELFREGPSEKPSDPALARLFPDAYGDGDEQARGLRRVPPVHRERPAHPQARGRPRRRPRPRRPGLRRRRPAGALPEEGRRWLGALNDLRLTIAARLEVTDDVENTALYRLPDSDPRKPMVMAYLWLGVLQETLVEALMP